MNKILTLFAILLLGWPMVEGAPTSKPTKVDRVLARARSYVGTPYKLGGTSRRGIDCSGLMVRSFQAIDFQLPRVSAQQARVGKPIRKTELRRGDMVFFAKGKKVSHVGLVYAVRGRKVKFIHAASSKGVTISSLDEPYWRKRYHSARRVIQNERYNPRQDRPVASTKSPITIKIEEDNRGRGRQAITDTRPRNYKPVNVSAIPGMFPQASRRVISVTELENMDPDRLILMKYEILARHGFEFSSTQLKRYFEMQNWYREIPKTRNTDKILKSLSAIERENIRRIRQIEEKRPAPSNPLLIEDKKTRINKG